MNEHSASQATGNAQSYCGGVDVDFSIFGCFLRAIRVLSDFSVASSASRERHRIWTSVFPKSHDCCRETEYFVAFLAFASRHRRLLPLLLTWDTLYWLVSSHLERSSPFSVDPVVHRPIGRVIGCTVRHRTPFQYKYN